MPLFQSFKTRGLYNPKSPRCLRPQIIPISFTPPFPFTSYHSTSHRLRLRTSLKMSSTTLGLPYSKHSHQHHHHDNTYLVSTNKKDAGVRITRIGLYVNFCMAIGKGLGGYLLNSQSLVADAFHSLTDLVSDLLTLATVSWSLKPPSPRFPSGYGKIESLGSLGVSSLLLAGGIGLGWHSCEILYSQLFVDAASLMVGHGHDHDSGFFGLSHSHNPADMVPSLHAAWIAGGSIMIKEYLYRASESSLILWRHFFVHSASMSTQWDFHAYQNCFYSQFTASFGQRLKAMCSIRPSPFF